MSMLLSFFVILLVLNMAWFHKWKTSIRLFSIDINGVLIHKTFNYSMFIWYIYLCNQVMNVCSVVFKCLHPYTYPYAKLPYEVQRNIIALYGLGIHDLIPMHGD